MKRNTLQTVMQRVAMGAGCWEWTGYRQPRGYGVVRVDGRLWQAHRYIYENTVGPVASDHELDHLCRNTSCVRPAHLEPVPHAVNVRRGDGGQHFAVRTHCPHGHSYDDTNTGIRTRRNGLRERRCKACAREYSRRYREMRP